MVMFCRNAFRIHKLKLVVIGNDKNHDCSRVPKERAFLSIIIARKEHGQIGRFFKIGSTSIHSRSSGFPERERITIESSVTATQCPFSSKKAY
jgi:hypothetical protein